MLRLPTRIEAHLTDTAGHALREPAVLVAVNLLSHGRYYFGNLIGLTNENGVAVIEGVELELRYLDDRARYPMDYKLELSDCDELIEVVLLSGAELVQAREAMAQGSDVASSIRSQYGTARNDGFTPAVVRLIGDAPHGSSLKVFVTTRPC